MTTNREILLGGLAVIAAGLAVLLAVPSHKVTEAVLVATVCEGPQAVIMATASGVIEERNWADIDEAFVDELKALGEGHVHTLILPCPTVEPQTHAKEENQTQGQVGIEDQG